MAIVNVKPGAFHYSLILNKVWKIAAIVTQLTLTSIILTTQFYLPQFSSEFIISDYGFNFAQ